MSLTINPGVTSNTAASATKNTNPTTATQEINIGEMLVYSSPLGDSQISALTTYLKNKWMGTN